MSSKKTVRRVADLASPTPAPRVTRGSIRSAIAQAVESLEGRRMLAANQTWVNDNWTLAIDSNENGQADQYDIVTTTDAGGPATGVAYGVQGFGHVVGGETTTAFETINSAIFGTNANGTVRVLAGTYGETVTVSKSLSLVGPNAAVAGAATRNPEAVLRASGNVGALITLSAGNVSVSGLLLEGDDPTLTGTTVAGGGDANAIYGIVNGPLSGGPALSNLTISNNVVRHVAIGFLGNSGAAATVASGNSINHNLFEGIGVYDFGYAVTLRNNFYANVTDNVMRDVWTGVHVNNFSQPSGAAWSVSGNDVHAVAAGMWFNQTYGGATPLTLNGNTFTAASGAVANNIGLLVTGGPGFVGGTITNDRFVGHQYGVLVYATDGNVSLGATNAISGATVGVYATNNAGFANPIGTTSLGATGVSATAVSISGVSISTGGAGSVGVLVHSDNNGPAVVAALSGATPITGGVTGIRVEGAAASLAGLTLASTAFAGQSGDFVALANNAMAGQTIAATAATFDGSTGAARSDAQNFALENKITHAVDNGSLGFVRVKSGNVFVTQASGSVQRGVNAAASGDNVNIDVGTFVEQVDDAAKSLVLVGRGTGTVIQSPAAGTLAATFTTTASGTSRAYRPVVTVRDGATTTITNLVVDGHGNGAGLNGDNFAGIAFHNAGGAATQVNVVGVRDATFSGVQSGVAVAALNDAAASPHAVAITNNDINDYQKTGILAYGPGLTATISNNTVTGQGPTTITAQNGIVLGQGATGTVSANYVSDNDYTPDTVTATGILLLNPAGTPGVTNNTLTDNQTGIYVSGASGNVNLSGNAVRGGDGGIAIDGSPATITNNSVTGAHAGGGGTGIYISGNSPAFISGNTIVANDVGLYLDQTGAAAISITNNPFRSGALARNTTDVVLHNTANPDGTGANTPTGAVIGGGNFFGASGDFIDNYTSTDQDLTAYTAANFDGLDPNTAAGGAAIENKIYHKVDDATLGLIRFGATPNVIYVSPAAAPTANDNDYTRIANAINAAGAGTTIVLTRNGTDATFDWTEANAAASWALGNDGVANTGDDYAAYLNGGVNDLTITADLAQGITIVGGGDLGDPSLEDAAFRNYATGAVTGLTFSNFTIQNFGFGIQLDDAGGANYSNLTIDHVHVIIAADNRADGVQTIGIYYTVGTDIHLTNNVLDFVGTGTNGASPAQIGIQSSTTGGTLYDGLQITGNTLNVAASNSGQRVLGIWENGHNAGADIAVSNNTFTDFATRSGSFDVTAFQITSGSGATGTVTYANNTVVNATTAFAWLALYGSSVQDYTGTGPVQLAGNTVTASGTAVDIGGTNASANLVNNDFDGATDAQDNGIDVRIQSGSGVVTFGANNQFGGQQFFIRNEDDGSITLAGYTLAANFENVADYFAVEDKLFHAPDSAGSGLIRFNGSNLYVTTPGTGASDETIQRAINASADGDTVRVQAGTYVESPTINKSITLAGSGRDVTTIALLPADTAGANYLAPLYVIGAGINVTISGLDVRANNAVGGGLANANLYVENGVGSVTVSNSRFEVGSVGTGTTGDDGIGIVTAYTETPGAFIGSVTVTESDFVPVGGAGGVAERAFAINSGVSSFLFDNNTIRGGFQRTSFTSATNGTVSNNVYTGRAGDTPGSRTGGFAALGYPDATYGITGFTNNTVSNVNYGIASFGATITASGNTITASDHGTYVDSGGTATLTNNDYNVGTDNLTDVYLETDAGTVTFGANNAFGGSNYFIENHSPVAYDLTGYNAGNFEGLNKSTLADAFTIEDRLFHALDNGTSGLIRFNGSNLYVTTPGTGASDESIQRAVNAASASGDTIHVATGTFTEQVDVDAKSLTIEGQGDATVIRSPAGQLAATFIANVNGGTAYRPVLTVENASGTTIRNLKVDGAGNGNANSSGRFAGIAFHDASGTISNVTVIDVRNAPFDGAQNGLGIYVRNESAAAPHAVTVTGSRVSGYQKNGITVDGAGLTGTISNNVVTGAGETGTIGQNGIQLSRGASATITGNTVSDNNYNNAAVAASVGILLTGSGNATVSGNTLRGNDVGVYASETGSSTIDISNNTFNADANRNEDDVVVYDTAATIGAGNSFGGTEYFVGNFSGNNYDLTAYTAANFDGLNPATLSGAFRIEDKIYHKLDDASVGLVRVVAGQLYVTTPGTGASDETIANAVAAASSGDTVNVEAGTYDLSAGVTIDKSITLLGARSGVSGTSGSRGTGETILVGAADQSVGVLSLTTSAPVFIDGFTLNGSRVFGNQPLNSDLTVRNNVFHLQAIAAAQGTNMIFGFPAHLVFADNAFTTTGSNPTNSAVIQVAGNYAGSGTGNLVEFRRNSFTGVAGADGQSTLQLNLSDAQGVVDANTFNGVDIGILIANNAGNLTVSGNAFSNITRGPSSIAGGSFGAGIALFNPTFTGPVSITGNTFSNSDAGIRTSTDGSGSFTLTDATLAISGNTFTNNLYHLVDKFAGTITPAGSNVFDGVTLGSASTAQLFAIADKVVDRVDVATYGFIDLKPGNVYVTANSFFAPGGTTAPSVQRGVDAADATETVFVAAGTYPGSVSVTNQLTLSGARAGVDARGRTGAESVLNGGSAGGVALLASGIVLDGFTVTGVSGGIYAAGIFTAGNASGIQVLNNVVTDNVMGLYLNGTNAIVRNNAFSNNNRSGAAAGNGIYSDQGLANASISQNAFAGHDNAAIVLAGAAGTQSNVSVDGNDVTGGAGFAFFNVSGLSVTRNLLANTDGSSIYIGGGNAGVDVGYNEISGSSSGAVTVDNYVEATPNSGISIHNNNLSNNAFGIRLYDGDATNPVASDAVTVQDNAFNGNAVGLRNMDPRVGVNATGNYWGASGGPNVATNVTPGPKGDSIDGAGAANVAYAPFRTDGTDALPGTSPLANRGFQPVAGTFDTTAPVAPATPDLDAASDSGASSTDNVTNDRTPTFSGTAEANSVVRLYAGPTLIGTAQANGSGAWQITSIALADGDYAITATATDASGNVSVASGSLSLRIDGTAPTASFVATPNGTAVEGSLVSVNGTVADNLSGVYSIAYTVTGSNGDAFSGTTEDFSFLPTDEGTYTISYTVTDLAGNVTNVVDSTYSVTNANPVATLSGPTTGNEGASLTFTGAATDAGVNDVLTYTYTVTKNGNPYAVTNNSGVNQTGFTFTPNDNGTYVVTLTVTDGDGGIDVRTITVAVANVAPTVSIDNAPASSPEGTPINLGSTVTDPGNDTFTYAWNVTKNGVAYASGNGVGFSFTPNDNGAYVVSLTVTDDDGGATTATATINVTNVAPTLSNVAVTNTQENGTVTLSGNYADAGSADTHTLLIDWGDGSAAQAVAVSGGAFSLTHQYLDDDADDRYTVTVTLADDDAGTASTSVVSTVTNVAPTATITGAPTSSPEGTTINLGSTVTDVGTLDTFTYSWLVTKNGSPYASGTNAAFSFTPDDNGTYNVTLLVTDDDGGQSIATKSINVTNVNPANVSVSAPATGSEGTAVNVTATVATDAGSADTLSYTYTVTKNGVAYGAPVTLTGSGATSFSFTPNDNATYVVTLAVSDDDGGTTTASTGPIVVANVAPTVTSFNVPATGNEGSPITVTAAATDPAGINDTLTYSWTVTKNGVAYSSGTGPSYTFTPDDDASYLVSLVVSDEDGGVSAPSTRTIAVADVAPRVFVDSLTPSINENGTATLSFHLVDPGAGDLAATQLVTIDWGDGSTPSSVSAAQLATLQAGGSVTLTHVYVDDATAGTASDNYTVSVSSFQTDESESDTLSYNNMALAAGSASPVVTVNNVAPTLTGFVTPTSTVPAGTAVSVSILNANDVSPRDRNVEGLRYTFFVDYNNNNVIDANELIRDANGTLIGGDGTYGGSITAASLVIPGTYFSTPSAGGYVVRGRVLDNDLGVASRSLTIVVTPVSFQVVTLTPNASGFSVAFNHTVDRSTINLYAGANAAFPTSDVVVTGPNGVVRGSLVFNAATNAFDFVSTGGILAPGTYTVSLASNANAFKDTNGALLDGDADGNAGGNYGGSFNVVAPTGPVLSLPDFARGTGQQVDVNPAVASSDLPVTLDTPTAISSINFKILFDPTLLSVPATGGVTLGSGVPSGWTVSYSIIGNALTVSLTKAGPAADIQPGTRELVKINASVVNNAANYGKAEVLSFSDIVVNGSGSIVATGDRAIHKGVFLGDADFDGAITSGDASLMQAIVLGYANGFSQLPLIDPTIVADSSGNGIVDSQDATNAALTDVGLRPAAIPAFTPVAVPAGQGADPTYGIPLNLGAVAGATVHVPVNITDDARGIQSGKITLSYDTSKLNLANGSVFSGTLTNGWVVVANVDDAAGTAIISFFNGTAIGGSTPAVGSLLDLAFAVEANAAGGVTPVTIATPTGTASSPTNLRDGNSALLTTNAASGSIVIDVPPTVSGVTFNYAGTGQSIVVGFSEDVGASIAAGDFELLNTTTNTLVQLVVQSISADGKTVTLRFANTGGVQASILQDGDYRLRVRAGQVLDTAGNANVANSDNAFFFMNADYDHNHTVDFADLLTLAQHYTETSGTTFAGGDANYDGRVDFDDLLLLAQRYTGTIPAALFSSTPVRSAPKSGPTLITPRKQTARASGELLAEVSISSASPARG